MKRKGERSIPDFSGKKKGMPVTELNRVKDHPPAPRDFVIKPKGTSAKSGQRGR